MLRLPNFLLGKRAYVQAVPHVLRGPMQHDDLEIPESRCYTAESWAALQQQQAGNGELSAVGAAAVCGSLPGTPVPGGAESRGATPAATPPPPAAAAARAAGDAGTPGRDTAPAGEQQHALVPASPLPAAGAAAGRGSRSTTWRSKLAVCQALEPKRIAFGKSGIHGWGIFARADIPADSMVTEFRGSVIRGVLADVREARYRQQVRCVWSWCVVWRGGVCWRPGVHAC